MLLGGTKNCFILTGMSIRIHKILRVWIVPLVKSLRQALLDETSKQTSTRLCCGTEFVLTYHL